VSRDHDLFFFRLHNDGSNVILGVRHSVLFHACTLFRTSAIGSSSYIDVPPMHIMLYPCPRQIATRWCIPPCRKGGVVCALP
jgi:hypothetical protein